MERSVLNGMKLAQIGDGLAAAVCGRLFADVGADVVAIDAAGDTPLAQHLNAEKTPVSAISSDADLIVVEGAPGHLQQLGRDFDASLLDDKLLRESSLKGLIDRKLLLQAAGDAGFAFSQPALDQVILQTPEFQTRRSLQIPLQIRLPVGLNPMRTIRM